ncbi:MAG TPA: methionine--tRNA ligase [Candidatus Saccharimonadales bacterium]|nr:methionine--tRNA ligase [Candidatus Saccharimonadales bacterium]
MSKFYITTPIYYINDLPHVGHAYSTIAADVLARNARGQGVNVFFSVGTDENGQKTIEAAEKAGKPVGEYADWMADAWKQTWSQLGISFDRFIRTTEGDHIKASQAFIEKVQAAGDIYKGEYEGLYCVGHEAFISETELVDGKCPEHNRAPEKRKEDNYFFKLSKYGDKLLKHINNNPSFIQPESRRNEVVAFINRGLEDISVSRQGAQWGIDWPGDKDQKVYVWFDALINYLTAVGYPGKTDPWWPADLHLVGKDIIKFHCIIWPAMLMSAGIPLPKVVFAHGFFTIDGKKISKSLGNAINPVELAGKYGVDALRFYLLREIPFGGDGEFSHERFVNTYETELANELGNAVQRVASMISRYQDGEIGPVPEASHDTGRIRESMEAFRLDRALDEIWSYVRGVNQYLEDEKPWEIAKTDKTHLQEVLAQAVSEIIHVAHLLLPFIPATSERILKTFEGGKVNADIGILFPKFDEPKRPS